MRFFTSERSNQSEGGSQTDGRTLQRNRRKNFSQSWRDNESRAFEIGLKIDEYWNLSPAEFRNCVAGFNSKQKAEIERADALNHILGRYISFAVNDPKHYPRKPIVAKNAHRTKKMIPVTIEALDQYARIYGGL